MRNTPTNSRPHHSFYFQLFALVILVLLVQPALATQNAGRLAGTATGQKTFEYRDLNFRITPPDSGYQNLEPEQINPAATVIIFYPAKKYNLMVIAEEVGPNLVTLEGLMEISKANLRANATAANFSNATKIQLANHNAVYYSATAKMGVKNFHYRYWLLEHKGFLYQIVASSSQAMEPHDQHINQLVASFEIIDPYRIAGEEGGEKITRFSSDYGYRINFANPVWSNWTDAEDDIWYPDLSGQIGDHSRFTLVPTCYTQGLPTGDALTYSLLRAPGLDYPDDDYQELGRVDLGEGGRLLGYQFTDDEDDEFHYRMLIVKNNECYYLLTLWTTLGESVANDLTKGLIAAWEIAGTPKPIPKEKLAWFYNGAGLYFYNRESYVHALEEFQKAAQLDPARKTYVTNVAMSYNRMSQYAEGLKFLQLPGFAQHTDAVILSWHAWFNYKLENYAAAAEFYQKGFALETLTEEDLSTYVDSLIQLQKFDAASAALEKHRPENPSSALALTEIRLAMESGQYEKALAMLEKAQEKGDADSSLAFSRMDLLAKMGNFQEVVVAANTLLERGQASARVYYYRGDAEFQLEQYLQAQKSFERALELAPGNSRISEYLRTTQAQLGKGDSSAISKEIEPVAWPSLTLPKTVSDSDKYDSYYLLRLRAYDFDPGRPMKVTHADTIRVRDQAGVRRFSTLTAEFNPLHEKLYINHLYVRDSAGKLVGELNRHQLYVSSADDYDQATFKQIVRVPVAGLAPGNSIEFVYTIEKIYATNEFRFERFYLSTDRPIGLSAIYVKGKVDDLLYNQAQVDPPKKQKNAVLWLKNNPPVYQREPMQVASEHYLSTVALSSKANWPDIGKDYRTRVKDLIFAESAGLAPILKDTRARLKTNTEAETIAALASYVQSTITYKALEFGVRGYTPHSPDQILADRFGDCKDHAVLLWRLLRAADINAELALVNLSGPVDKALPSLDQFDHMAVYLPEFRGGTLIDATDKDINLLHATPSSLGDNWALILSDSPQLVKIPPYTPSRVDIQRDINLAANGDLSIAEKIQLTTYFASSFRSHLKGIEARDRLNWVQKFLSGTTEPVIVESLKIDNLFETDKDLILDLRYRVKPNPLALASGLFVDPAYWEIYYLSNHWVHDRQTDFQVSYPLIIDSRVSLQTPYLQSTQAQATATSWIKDAEQKSEFGHYQLQGTSAKGAQQWHFNYQSHTGRFRAKDYADYHAFHAQLIDLLRQPLQRSQPPLKQ